MATGSLKLIDNSVKDTILRYPTVELIRKLFPDVVLHGRSVLRNPLRGEKHASLSCFRDRSGCQRWKDHATDETGDNIDFFRKVYPELGYVEAVERMSLLLFGRSALVDVPAGTTIAFHSPLERRPPVHVPAREAPSALQLQVVLPYGKDSGMPGHLVEYTRGRGISDEVASRYFNYVRFVNTNRAGRSVIDSSSGLPVVGDDGEIVREDGVNDAVALRNDIGGFSLRVPESAGHDGFKGTNMSFLSTVLADGSAPAPIVSTFGDSDFLVTHFRYDAATRKLHIGNGYGFSGVEPYVAPFAMAFLDSWTGRYLEGRERLCVVAMLSAMNGPVHRTVAVVEGMFDGASVIELERLAGRGCVPGRDLVILNSLSNLKWAVPFLAMHGEVCSLLDNDLRSAAGEKAFAVLKQSVESFAGRVGVSSVVISQSSLFYPSKDMNDYLKTVKGFGESRPVPGKALKDKKTSPGRKKSAKGNSIA